ncbi:MAG: hypothetical protein M9899_03340 [Bdellovibrionaceae bacterium]|nr:hypothetical protein [Pseudobdellovibrionaceae bacterium]
MRYKILSLGLSGLLALSACGSDSAKSSSKSNSYRYNFTVSNCTPSVFKGRFSTLAEMCQALSYQAQLHPCAAPQILRQFEDKNCHRGDLLQTGNQPYSPSPGVFYNANNEPYILTPNGPVVLERPDLHDEPMRVAYETAETELDDGLICEHGVCRKPGEKLEIRNGKVYLDGVLAYDPTLNDSNIYGPNHPNYGGQTGSTLVRPDQQRPETGGKDRPPVKRPSEAASVPITTPKKDQPETIVSDAVADVPLDRVPIPRPRPADLGTTKEEVTRPAGTVTEDPRPSQPADSSVTTPAETAKVDTPETAKAETPNTTAPSDATPKSPEEVSDVSEETRPESFNLIYFTSTGAMYTEIPNPQNEQRFPILKITAKIDSRSPLHNKKHSSPIKELDVAILGTDTPVVCRPIAQISSNNDIVILTLKTKDQSDVSQLQACKEWFQVVRKSNFEIQTSELQTDKGSISGKFNFVISE